MSPNLLPVSFFEIMLTRIDLPLYSSRDELETYITLVINMELTGFSME
jgi:hypothetical protein